MRRTLLTCGLFFLAAIAPARAANVPPELYQILPALTLTSGATAAPITLTNHLRDPDVPGSAVQITVRMAGTTSTINLALFDATAPLTVANFKNYITSGRFAANFFHRSVPGFIIQTGGYRFVAANTFDVVPTFPAVQNEFGASNLRGTIAMAKIGGNPNSATSGWFINLANNSANLDAQNGGFTVFGRVLGTGMTVADQIAAYPRYDTTPTFPWDELPLTAASLSQQYFIESDAALISPIAYQVSIDDPALVTVALTDGVLQLTGSASTAGQTTVRLTTTDLEGGTIVSAFAVTVLSSNPLIAWRQSNFATTAETGSSANLADPDSDGIPNLLEYALGLSPTVPNTTGLPALQASAGNLTFTYKRAVASGLTYAVQTTTNLADSASWSTTGVDQGTPAGDGTTTASISYASGVRFLRLQVSLTP